jgi:hypothetical protein
LLPPENSLIPQFNFILDENILDFDLNSTHFYDVILFQEIVLGVGAVLDLQEAHNVVHALTHLQRRQSGLTLLQVKVVDVMRWIVWHNSLDEVFVPNFVDLEKFLIPVSKLLEEIRIQVHKLDACIISNTTFTRINLETRSDDLSHFIVEEPMRIFLPLDSFHHQLLVVELVVELILKVRVIRKNELVFIWDVALHRGV